MVPRMRDVLIIGAGVAGLKAAGDLAAGGKRVLVLEKSRGFGGRAATRRWEGTRVDHGAQFFTARDPAFRQQVDRWVEEGLCFEWCRGFHQWRENRLTAPVGAAAFPRFAVRHGMNGLGKELARGLEVRRETTVTALRTTGHGWEAVGADGAVYAGAALLLTTPAPQAQNLLLTLDQPPSDLLEILRQQRVAPSIAVMAAYPEAGRPDWNGIQADDTTVGWIGLNSGKHPAEQGQIVVMHAADGFSKAWQDRDLEEAADLMVERAAGMGGEWLRRPAARAVHRWRYARPLHPAPPSPFASSVETPGLFLAGDGLGGGKIEGAWLSGRAAAAALAVAG